MRTELNINKGLLLEALTIGPLGKVGIGSTGALGAYNLNKMDEPVKPPQPEEQSEVQSKEILDPIKDPIKDPTKDPSNVQYEGNPDAAGIAEKAAKKLAEKANLKEQQLALRDSRFNEADDHWNKYATNHNIDPKEYFPMSDFKYNIMQHMESGKEVDVDNLSMFAQFKNIN